MVWILLSPVPYEASGEVWVEELRRTEPEQKMGAFGQLPPELHKVIVNALAQSNNLEQVIEAIKVAGILSGVRYDNLKDFTALMDILAKKFPDMSRQEIAAKFDTEIARSIES